MIWPLRNEMVNLAWRETLYEGLIYQDFVRSSENIPVFHPPIPLVYLLSITLIYANAQLLMQKAKLVALF